MKYFIDTEFHEYHKQVKLAGIKIGKPIPTIDLISIGIVSEEVKVTYKEFKDNRPNKVIKCENIGKEYYAICKDFNLKDVWYSNQGTKEKPNYWLRENVVIPIIKELTQKEINKTPLNFKHTVGINPSKFILWFGSPKFKEAKRLLNKYGKTKKQITEDIIEFTQQKAHTIETGYEVDNIEFYAYYADYDWVVFCQLFGTMMNLPKGFPMYCNDLKQTIDEKYMRQDNKYSNMTRLEAWEQDVKQYSNYPKQTNEHNALSDAKWNKKLYEFIKLL